MTNNCNMKKKIYENLKSKWIFVTPKQVYTSSSPNIYIYIYIYIYINYQTTRPGIDVHR